jgi:DNA topoisomerase IB
MQRVADRLGNTPAICRKSYVPENLVMAFESGRLKRMAGRCRPGATLLSEVLAKTLLSRRRSSRSENAARAQRSRASAGVTITGLLSGVTAAVTSPVSCR